MRSKLLKHFWLNCCLFSLSAVSASAAITIVPYNVPNTVNQDTAGLDKVFYLDVSFPGQGAPGYSTHDFNGATNFYFTINGADPAQGNVWVFAESKSSSTTFYPIPIANCSGLDISVEGRCVSGANTSFTLGINFKSVCNLGTNKANILGCDGTSAVDLVTKPISGFHLKVFSGGTTAVGSTSGTLLQVIPEIAGPTISTQIPTPGFFPGDSSVLVDTNSITAVPDNVTNTGSSTIFPSVWVVAEKNGTVTPGSEMSATLRQVVPYTSGTQEVSGFANSTDTTVIPYQMAIGVQDSAGAISFQTTIFTGVFATDIQGFLRESNCFIATASFRDGRAAGVMLLREFRDEILSEFSYGRDFIRWYYAYGPLAAKWLLAHPIFRSFFLMLLLPLEALAWILLHPAFFAAPILGFILIGFFLRRGRRSRV